MTFRQKYIYGKEPIEINAGRRTVRVTVSNTGDRAVQVGSHYHFFEVNSALSFDRQETLGMHLNIAAGTSVRFEPGGSREVELCTYAGTGRLVGFSGLLNGSTASQPARLEAVRRAIEQGFQGAQNLAATTDAPHGSGEGGKNGRGAERSKETPAHRNAGANKDTKEKKKGSR
ncbi:urease subunit beta [Streptomyces sp. DT171]|uniref:urease subunit beta n=1 Tax=Streptomyces sp. DT171 TaxID=3416524 RepID=UPI003CF4BFBA